MSLLTILTDRNLNFKNPRWRTAANLKTVTSPVLQNPQHRNSLQGLDQNSWTATESAELSSGDYLHQEIFLADASCSNSAMHLYITRNNDSKNVVATVCRTLSQ